MNAVKTANVSDLFRPSALAQEMCASIGVDPLASGKGFWSEMLGVGDFYYELGVQIVEVCMAASARTGGLMEIGELKNRLMKSRGKTQQVMTEKCNNSLKHIVSFALYEFPLISVALGGNVTVLVLCVSK